MPASRALAFLTMIGLTAAGTVVLAPTAALAATAGSLTAAPGSAIAGERVVLRGALPPKRSRPVQLQRLNGTTWVRLASKTSSSTGAFSFATTARASTTTYRVFAPRVTLGGTVRPAVSTPARTVVTLAQAAMLSLPSSGTLGDTVSAGGTFTPVRAGRPVRLERMVAGVWQTEQTGTESAQGLAGFAVSLDSAGDETYRVVASAWHGAAEAVSAAHTIAVSDPTGDTTPPGPVTDLTVTGTTTGSISLSWTNPADADLTGVMIRRAAGLTPPASPSAGTLVVDEATPGTSHTDAGLSAGKAYSYALFAHDAVPNYATSATTTGTTGTAGDTTPPGPVTGLSVTGTTSGTVTLSWTNPADADLTGVMIRRAKGGTPPAGPTAGTKVTDEAAPGASYADSGLLPGTQYSYSLFAHDGVPNYASGTSTTATTTAATAADWAQPRHDAEHRGWSPAETIIGPANAGSVAEEWTTTGGSPAIVGTTLYVISPDALTGEGRLTAYDLTTGAVSWRISTGSCASGPVSVTASLILLRCGQLRAYDRGGDHALVWDTAVTDPGQSLGSYLVLGDRVVAWGPDRVVTYQLADGQRAWQQLLPTGAQGVVDVAASGGVVTVAYDDRLRALSATNGSQLWSDAAVVTAQVVIADGWVYTNQGNGVARYALSTGVAGWDVLPQGNIYRIEAADGDTVYAWEAVFDFGPPSPSVLHALRTSDGGQRWQYDVPSRIRSVAVVGDVVWVTSSDIYSQGRSSDLIALDRTTGAELRRVTFDDNIYGGTDIAFGDGKVALHQGGSAGGPTPHTLRVFGLAGPRPSITTSVVPLGRVGTTYSRQLEATGSGPFTWAVASGALPPGVTLSSSGLLSGTPTTAQTTRATLRVTGTNGRVDSRSLPFGVVASATSTWTTTDRDATRNPLESGTGCLDLADVATFAFRWRTASPGPITYGQAQEVVTSGATMYTVAWDGYLRAFDTTGSQATRAPLWSAQPSTGGGFVGPLTLAGDRLLVTDSTGMLHAVRTSDGADLWHTDTGGVGTYEAPLVVGSSVFVRDSQSRIGAFSLTDGSPLWGGAPSPVVHVYSPLSSDGTRIFAMSDCELYAIKVSDGSAVWHAPVVADSAGCAAGFYPPPAPIVVGNNVYASEPAGRMVADAATGAVSLRFASWGYNGGNAVVVGGLWVFLNDDRLVAVDTATGELAWRSTDTFAAMPRMSSTGDLLLVTSQSTGNLVGVSRLTGETVWDGGTLASVGGSPVIGGSRILLAAQDGTRAYGPL